MSSMPFVLYALGAALLGWSGLTIIRTEGYGALDIAATLAGAGVLAIGFGAVAAAVARAGRRIGDAIALRPEIALRSEPEVAPAEPQLIEPEPIEPRPAPAAVSRPANALPVASTLAERTVESEDQAPAVAPSRAEAAMAVKRGLRPAIQPARPRGEPSPEAVSAPEVPSPRPPDPKAVKAAKPVPERRRWPVLEPEAAAVSEAAAPEPAPEAPRPEPVAPEPVAPETPAPKPPAPKPAAPARSQPIERRPRPSAAEKKPAPAPEPTPVAEPAPSEPAPPEPAPVVEPAPSIEPVPETASAETPGASTPEWLIRARARREARAKAEAEEGPAPPAVEPEPFLTPEPAEASESEEGAVARVVLREGEHNGVVYRFLEGGAIEAESLHGTRLFASIDELKATVAQARAPSADPDAPLPSDNQPAADADALDAAISALEDPAEGQGAGPRS